MSVQSIFRETYSFEKRSAKAEEVKTKHPDHIPVVVEKAAKARVADISKNKFVVPANQTWISFILSIKTFIKLDYVDQGVHMFVNNGNTIPSQITTISQLYKQYQNEDGILYVNYTGETVFGDSLLG